MEGKSSLETRGVDAREKVQIRRVLKDGEYLVALVGKSGVETGVPVGQSSFPLSLPSGKLIPPFRRYSPSLPSTSRNTFPGSSVPK